jgi:large subunit ribosomal protein L4
MSETMAGAVTVNVVDASGKTRGTLELAAAVFGAPIHGALLHQAVVRELNGRRAGTHDTKGRSEVSGGGKKPWKQKGTGRARQGSIRATQWKGGGKPFGPTPRSYAQAMPRQARRSALRAAWTDKVTAGQLTVVERLDLAEPKTKTLVGLLAGLGAAEVRTLLVVSEPSAALVRACQNVPWLTLGRPGHVTVAELLRHDRVVAERQALVTTQEGLRA